MIPNPKQYPSAPRFEVDLVNAGWRLLPGGSAGRVYEHSLHPKIVLKVSDGDPCYMGFARWAQVNRRLSVHIPKLRIVHDNGIWGLVVVERLFPLSKNNVVAIDNWFWAGVKQKGVFPATPASWVAFAHLIAKIPGGCCNDMKPQNAMQRGSEIIFFDPLN